MFSISVHSLARFGVSGLHPSAEGARDGQGRCWQPRQGRVSAAQRVPGAGTGAMGARAVSSPHCPSCSPTRPRCAAEAGRAPQTPTLKCEFQTPCESVGNYPVFFPTFAPSPLPCKPPALCSAFRGRARPQSSHGAAAACRRGDAAAPQHPTAPSSIPAGLSSRAGVAWEDETKPSCLLARRVRWVQWGPPGAPRGDWGTVGCSCVAGAVQGLAPNPWAVQGRGRRRV